MATSQVLGVVVLARHGDRSGFYQNPQTYTASDTVVTPLGETQCFQLGQHLRSTYFDPASTSAVKGIAGATLVDSSTIDLRADAGGEGSVIFDSAVAMSQGLFPATTQSAITLANGTTVTSPLGGYQYVSIQSVEPNEDVSLEGWTSCNAFTDNTKAVYASSAWQAKASASADALNSLRPLLGNRNDTLVDAYNSFDYINVNSIHNATFLAMTSPQQLGTARDLANYHETALFTSSSPSGVGNIAGNAILPTILGALQSYTNASAPIRYTHLQISYKPFISLWNLTDVPLSGLVDYASYMAFELRQPSTGGDPVVRLTFRNGTDGDATTFNMFGNTADTPLSQVQSTLGANAITNLGQWCSLCNQQSARGCDVISQINGTASNHGGLSLAAAGGIGAGVTLGVVFLAIAALAVLGLLSFGRKRRNNHLTRADSDSAASAAGMTQKQH